MSKLLFDDAFKFYETHGLDLADQHDILLMESPGTRINLYKFALDAAKAGWGNKKIMTTIKTYCDAHNIKFEFKKG